MIPTAVKRADQVNFWVLPGLKKGSEVAVIKPPQAKFERISEIVLNHYNLAYMDVMASRSRKRERVVARQLIMYFSKKYTTMSLKSIGERFLGTANGRSKDHTTVIHSIRTINNLRDTDRDFDKEVFYLESQII